MERTPASTLLHLTRVRLTQDYPAQVEACLQALDEDEIWWRPNEQTNAIGNLVVHLSWSNRYYFEQIIAGRDIGRDRDAEFAIRGGLDTTALRDLWNRSIAAVGGVLDGLSPGDMDRTTDRTGKATTYAQILMHVTHHNATHMGQIIWITKMRRPGALDEIWFKARVKGPT